MKRLFATTIFGFASLGAYAQSEPIDAGTLRQAEYPDPRGSLVVRSGQPPGRPAEARQAFETVDRNGDGVIDPTEASAYLTLANDFDHADTNHDRRVSRREYDRW